MARIFVILFCSLSSNWKTFRLFFRYVYTAIMLAPYSRYIYFNSWNYLLSANSRRFRMLGRKPSSNVNLQATKVSHLWWLSWTWYSHDQLFHFVYSRYQCIYVPRYRSFLYVGISFQLSFRLADYANELILSFYLRTRWQSFWPSPHRGHLSAQFQ